MVSKRAASSRRAVRRELFGPSDNEPPRGKAVDCSSGSLRFDTREESWGQFHELTTLQEILTQSDPLRRYGIGVLYSGAAQRGTAISSGADSADGDDPDITWVSGLAENEGNPDGPPAEINVQPKFNEADSDDFDLTDANTFKPSAMAISFKCRVPAGGSLEVTVRGASYDRISTHIPGVKKPRDWWLRRPFELLGAVPGRVLVNETNRLRLWTHEQKESNLGLFPSYRFSADQFPESPTPTSA